MPPEVRETEKTGKMTPPFVPSIEDTLAIARVSTHISQARTYRDKFRSTWDEVEKQIRCVKPESWDNKKKWQTKIFIPLQAKKSETANAYLGRMLYGQKRFFNISGNERKDKSRESALMDLFDYNFTRGRFHYQNDFTLHESCDIGTGFMKLLVKDGTTPLDRHISFHWRSSYNILFDPSCGSDFYKSTYVIDEDTVDISDLIQDAKDGKGLYSKETINNFLKSGASKEEGETKKDMMTVLGIDGVTYSIPKAWKSVVICEYWGKDLKKSTKSVKVDGVEKEQEVWTFVDKIITTFNDTFVARNVENDYGFIPIYKCTVKPRKYDAYGLGFCENTRGLQELMNSMVNLGFDSLKISSMDIIGLDVNKVAEPASINYSPLAVWKFKGNPREAMDRNRQGMSALSEIIRGIQMLDQIDQEASGVFRQIQGAPDLQGGSTETLGEYNAKLQLIDQRFLKIGRFIEVDYIEPMLRGMFKILTNKKFFNQQIFDRVLGREDIKKQVPTDQIDPQTQQPVMKEEVVGNKPRLDFEELAGAGDMSHDFKAVGMTQFFNKVENSQKLEKILGAVLKSPQLMLLSRVDKIWQRALQTAELPDYEEFLKPQEDVEELIEKVGAQAFMPPGGMPQP